MISPHLVPYASPPESDVILQRYATNLHYSADHGHEDDTNTMTSICPSHWRRRFQHVPEYALQGQSNHGTPMDAVADTLDYTAHLHCPLIAFLGNKYRRTWNVLVEGRARLFRYPR